METITLTADRHISSSTRRDWVISAYGDDEMVLIVDWRMFSLIRKEEDI